MAEGNYQLKITERGGGFASGDHYRDGNDSEGNPLLRPIQRFEAAIRTAILTLSSNLQTLVDFANGNGIPIDGASAGGSSQNVVSNSSAISATMSAAATTIRGASANRADLIIRNTGSNTVWIHRIAASDPSVVADSGFPLYANEVYEITSANLYQGEISGICASGQSSIIKGFEGYE